MIIVHYHMSLLYHYYNISGELLTVAPWAAKVMPGLFALNERIIMSGTWRHGLFVFAAVGAYNVGSIAIDMAQVCVM